MPSLILFDELFINSNNINFTDLVAFLAIISGIFILNSKNPIISVLFLISLFGCISIYLILLGLDFLGLSYIIVYIGAVSILFLFILMLINIRISELQDNTANSLPLGIILLASIIIIFFQILPYSIAISNNYNNTWNMELYNIFFNKDYNSKLSSYNLDNDLYFSLSNSWDNNIVEVNHISSIGNMLYTSHNIWLLITSYILLLAMIGAIIITIKIVK